MEQKISNLYEYAEQNNIDVGYFLLTDTKALSIPGAVALNPQAITSTSETKVCLAHELGHQATNSFYKVNSKFETRERMEKCATRWAVARLVPLKDLKAAFGDGITEIWELAEHFDVTPEFMENVINVYQEKGKL